LTHLPIGGAAACRSATCSNSPNADRPLAVDVDDRALPWRRHQSVWLRMNRAMTRSVRTGAESSGSHPAPSSMLFLRRILVCGLRAWLRSLRDRPSRCRPIATSRLPPSQVDEDDGACLSSPPPLRRETAAGGRHEHAAITFRTPMAPPRRCIDRHAHRARAVDRTVRALSLEIGQSPTPTVACRSRHTRILQFSALGSCRCQAFSPWPRRSPRFSAPRRGGDGVPPRPTTSPGKGPASSMCDDWPQDHGLYLPEYHLLPIPWRCRASNAAGRHRRTRIHDIRISRPPARRTTLHAVE
jgi:hypothetical protein